MSERPITEDTKRALEIIAPMAKELGIRVSADGHYLFCNGQAIGIACNSTYATVIRNGLDLEDRVDVLLGKAKLFEDE